MGEENRLSYANGSMMSSWQISFDGVKSRNKIAANLLLFWGFIDNSDLWWGLFHLALECENERCVARDLPAPEMAHDQEPSSNWLVDLAENESTFLGGDPHLARFFIRKPSQRLGYAIHPVLHHWARSQVPATQINSYLNTAAAVLGRASPLAHLPHAWLTFRRLTPHVDRFWHLVDQQKDFVATAPDGFNGLGFFEFDRCNYVNAERAMEMAVKGWLQTVGLENPVGMQCYFDVALSWRVLGKYDKAETRMLEVLERCSIIEGPLAKTTLRSLDDLGRLYVLREQYEKAVGYFLRAWKGKEQVWGPDNVFTLDTVRQLGLLYQKMGRLDEAHALHRKVLAGFENQLAGSKWIMLALSDLGMLHHRMGRLEEADLFLSKAFTTMRDQYGRDHSETEGIARNLAAVYRDRGLLDKEKALLEKHEFDI
ncbi:hypothetical protein BDV97DRAFT_137663 [Delphinella strobiligena]|nr:hypothetical protein BDV97DRAFT_137663 [Delphinella strobiligena]